MSEKGWTATPWETTPPEWSCTNHYTKVSAKVFFTEVRGPDGENCLYMGVEGREIKHPNAARIVACVNACADIPKPEALGALVKAAEFAQDWLEAYRYTGKLLLGEQPGKVASKITRALRAIGIEVK